MNVDVYMDVYVYVDVWMQEVTLGWIAAVIAEIRHHEFDEADPSLDPARDKDPRGRAKNRIVPVPVSTYSSLYGFPSCQNAFISVHV